MSRQATGPPRASAIGQRLDDKPRRSRPRVLLLTGDKQSVANGKLAEHLIHDEVGALDLACFVFNPEWLDSLAHKAVGEFLFAGREARPVLPLQEVHHSRASFRAAGRSHGRPAPSLARLVESRHKPLQFLVAPKGHHRGLAAGKEHGIVVLWIDLVDASGVL